MGNARKNVRDKRGIKGGVVVKIIYQEALTKV